MRALALATLLPTVLLVSACGGDSSSSDDIFFLSSGAPESGRATKGVLQQAEVLAYQRVSGGWSLATSTQTDDEGAFTFANGLPEGIVRIVVKANGAGTSRMVCDAASGCGAANGDAGDLDLDGVIEFGESMPMPAGLALETVLPGVRPANFEIAVTPATHLAAKYIERMPGEPSDAIVEMAHRQVVGVLGLDEGIFWREPVDLVDPTEVAAASGADLQHALISAAFAELGAATPETTLGLYAYRYAGLAGQLPVTYGASVNVLAAAAGRVLDHVNALRAEEGDAPLDGAASLDAWAAGWKGNVTDVGLNGAHDPQDLARARTSLDQLDHYLRLAGIDESATFAQTQLAQFDWMYNESMLGLLQVMFESVVAVVDASIQASMLELEELPPESVPISMPSVGLTATYTVATRELVISGTTEYGQQVAITFAITPLLSGLQAGTLSYEVVSGSIINAQQTGAMSGTMLIEFFNDTTPLVEGMMNGTTEPMQAFLAAMHVKVGVVGTASLADSSDTSKALAGEIDAWAEVDVPALQNEDTFIQLQITSGQGSTPNGDTLYSLEGETPALHIGIDDNATLQTAFGFEAFGLPPMEVRANGGLDGLDAIVAELLGDLAGMETLDPTAIIQALLALDISLLDLHGTGTLDIDDPAGHQAWQFVLDGNRLDASQPNSTENALSFYITSLEGGFIYSGGQPVAAVTVDWLNLGATVHAIDGTSDSYFLGSLEQLLSALPPVL